MTGQYIQPHGIQKSREYLLNNGYTATVEYSLHYGDHVTRFDSPDGTYWHCSNGLKDLPDFARSWVRGGTGVDATLINPQFEKIHQ